jgi:probable rRNA maturation factor
VITVHIADEQTRLPADADRLRDAIRGVLAEAGIARAEISLALVDNATLHELNRRFLGHDEPTDVLAFTLERTGDRLEGEVVVSTDMAAATAPAYGWSAADELLLYVIHGALHLVGLDDRTPADLEAMRRRERDHLARFGLEPCYQEAAHADAADNPGSAGDPTPSVRREP